VESQAQNAPQLTEYQIHMLLLEASTKCTLTPEPHEFHDSHAGYDGLGYDRRPRIYRTLCPRVADEMFRLGVDVVKRNPYLHPKGNL
jgi:hypothetical protein